MIRSRNLLFSAFVMAFLFSSCGSDKEKPATDSSKQPENQSDQDTPKEETVEAPVADLLDIVFHSDGTAEDISKWNHDVKYVEGPTLVTYYNEDYSREVASFNRKMGQSITSGYYRIDYENDQAFKDALADGHSLEVVFKANHRSDGSAEVKMFSSHQAGGTGFLISVAARGTALNFLPNVSSNGASNWIWTSSGINPSPGVYYHVVGVWSKSQGRSFIYVDGSLKGKADAAGSLNFPTPSSCQWFAVGGDPGGYLDSCWDGDIVLARIYDEPLSAKQVKALYEKVQISQSGEAFAIENPSFLPSAQVKEGWKFRVYGNGFKDGDILRLVPLGSEDKGIACETAVDDGFAALTVPSGLESGKYKMIACRGSLKCPVGIVDIEVTDNPSNISEVKVIGHRGYHDSSAPENSIASLKKAQDLGIYGAEFDVWITTDGVTMVNHDGKYSGDSHEIQNSTYSEIKDLKLSNGESVPTLADYLEQGKKDENMRLVLEIKAHNTAEKNKAVTETCVREVQEAGLTDRVDWISFSLDNCLRVKSLLPHSKVQYLTGDKTPEELHAQGIDGIDYQTTYLDKNPDYISRAHKLGMTVNVWTVNDALGMLKYIGQGVDFITTDYPQTCKEASGKTFITEE